MPENKSEVAQGLRKIFAALTNTSEIDAKRATAASNVANTLFKYEQVELESRLTLLEEKVQKLSEDRLPELETLLTPFDSDTELKQEQEEEPAKVAKPC